MSVTTKALILVMGKRGLSIRTQVGFFDITVRIKDKFFIVDFQLNLAWKCRRTLTLRSCIMLQSRQLPIAACNNVGPNTHPTKPKIMPFFHCGEQGFR